MLNGDWSQAVDGTMGVHMPCPYTPAPWPSMAALHCPRQPLGQGGLELERQMEVVGKLAHPCCCHRAAPSRIILSPPSVLYFETTKAFKAENITTKKVVEYFPALTR